jgi:hypothetical protein
VIPVLRPIRKPPLARLEQRMHQPNSPAAPGFLTLDQHMSRAMPAGPRLLRMLTMAYRSRQPVLLVGTTGVGKSQLAEQAAAELGVGYLVLDLTLLEPSDLVGLPQVQGGRTTFAAPSLLPREGQGILVLEELNRADLAVRQPALQFSLLADGEPELWSLFDAHFPAIVIGGVDRRIEFCHAVKKLATATPFSTGAGQRRLARGARTRG